MTPYLDAGFFITLLVPTDGTPIAKELLKEMAKPCLISLLHELQAQTFITMNEKSADKDLKRAAQSGRAHWQWLSDEGFLAMLDVDWNLAFHTSLNFIHQTRETPPPPLLTLHPIIAAISGATDFLSFDPRSRSIAKKLSLNLLPKSL